MKKITNLIDFVLNDTLNIHKEISIGRLSKRHGKILYDHVGVNYKRSHKILDSSAIRHTMRKHGNVTSESKRGANRCNLTYKDFELLPRILSEPDEIIYKGKNSQKQDVFCFNKRVGYLYIAAMSIRVSKISAKIVFSSLYIRK
jgi:hypothetical protein